MLTRRSFLESTVASLALAAVPGGLAGAGVTAYQLSATEEVFLEDLTRRGCAFFWDHGNPITGQVLDRARAEGPETRRMASIAATGFGLTALCIADRRGYYPHLEILERARNTLRFHWTKMPQEHGFFYHFSDSDSGVTARGSELSSIDTALLLCGILACRVYFNDAEIHDLATKIYQRVDWPWMLNGGQTFSMGWFPEKGFIKARWDAYSEELMIYLLAIGSPTHAVSAEYWKHIARPKIRYDGIDYVSNDAPIFIHQYSHAWFDFRNKHDDYQNYFENSVKATQAHKRFCLDLKGNYSEEYWGISASDSAYGYTAWGGPPAMGQIDGSVVPCAAAGSLAFVPRDCLYVLMALRKKYGTLAWGRYGFVDAFNPALPWYDPDVLGIDLGIGVLMAENLRTGFVWSTFMKNPEMVEAMRLCRFHAV